MGLAQETRQTGIRIRRVPGLDRQADERRNGGIDRALQFGERRAQRRMIVLIPLRSDRIAAQAQVRGMLIGAAVQRANDGELVHHRRQPRHVLADFDARDVRPDRLERSANLDRRLHLQVEHVLVRWTTGQIDHDDGFVREILSARRRRGLLRPAEYRGSESPPSANPPIFRKCRRECPSQNRDGRRPRMESMARSFCKLRENQAARPMIH